jgi:hypothetical protein
MKRTDVVACAYDPIYAGSRGRRITIQGHSHVKSMRFYLKNKKAEIGLNW